MFMSALALVACAPFVVNEGDPPPTEDPTEAAYDLDHMLRVDIELPEDDWAALRSQTRTLSDTILGEDCQSEPFESPFTWFEASVTLDDLHLDRVDVRKKGFLGSLSEEKPALKLDLGEYDSEARFHGVRRLTLNNAVSDPALVRQCVGYGFFDDMGVPASRCSLARVSVNGEDLGIYVNVEPIKKPMLERHFVNGEGNLYEGTLSDFREGWTGTIEKKNNEDADDWSDIEALTEAAAADDDELLDALAGVIDLDAFFTFWAAEVLTLHSDGYAGNTNNFYLYADPADGLLRFIPWGIDAVFYQEAEEDGGDVVSVYAWSILTWRLYNHEEGRRRYVDTLADLLERGWDEDAAVDRVDRMTALIEPELSAREWREVESSIDYVLQAIEGRRPDLEEVLEEGAPDWPYEPRDSYCFEPAGLVDVSFETTWGSILGGDLWTTGSSSIHLELEEGETWIDQEGSALAGEYEDYAYFYVPTWISDTEAIVIYVATPMDTLAEGSIELDLDLTFGALLYADFATMDDFEFVSYVTGTLVLDTADTSDEGPIVGRIDGQFLWL